MYHREGDVEFASPIPSASAAVKIESGSLQPSPNPNLRSQEFSRLKSNYQESTQSDAVDLKKTIQLKTKENIRLHLELQSLRYQNSAFSRRRRQELKTAEEERHKYQSEISRLSKENMSLRQDIEQLNNNLNRFRHERDIEVVKQKN